MNKHWYLIAGDYDEAMIVNTTLEMAEFLADAYVEKLEYEIYLTDDVQHAQKLIESRSSQPPYFPTYKKPAE
ncbi:hypothetical protein [Paenibacillus oryzisoli]|uniref:Uncharacterized protein n=1 Tax=Paenibacillus oryzisoli TaxID=1850517 RepID=A0A198AIP5_9BACL|nr:hypothetical protein [Paenibacillus oryzisoli]OAS21374.1 hypothetical protein A8708_31395 [Paenibacillus oryzisoli]